jgi:hypothetical protein
MDLKAKIINFEFSYNNFIVNQGEANDESFEEISLKIIQASKEGYNAIIGLFLVLGLLYQNNPSFFQLLEKIQLLSCKLGIKKMILITGRTEQFNLPEYLDYEILHYPFEQNFVYQSYKYHTGKLQPWNPLATKFLFPTGIPGRTNRLYLIKRFYEIDFLKNAEWSFFKPWDSGDKQWCREFMKDYSDEDYDRFFEKCERKIDPRYIHCKLNTSPDNLSVSEFENDPAWFDPTIFSNTVFSLITESVREGESNLDTRFLTEKTWRTIVNRHPFIFSSTPEMYNYLKSQGFKTFEEYMLIEDYGNIIDELERLDAIIKNVEYFLNNFKRYEDQIKQDIEYNYVLFFKKIEENYKLLDLLNTQYNISKEELAFWFEQKNWLNLNKEFIAFNQYEV